jgi:hypothetical protein
MQDAMREAPRIVLNGFELRTTRIWFGTRPFYEGTRRRHVAAGHHMLRRAEEHVGVVVETARCCNSGNISTPQTIKDAA